MARYHASLIGGQNVVFRPYIDVAESGVTFKIPGFLSGETHTVAFDNISDIKISGNIISKAVEIYTTGSGIIKAEGFSSGDANSVKREIEYYQQLRHNRANPKLAPTPQPKYEYTPAEVMAEQFTHPDQIPQIHFSHEKESLFNTLNTLRQYANQGLNSKDPWLSKLSAQADKLEEGIALARMKGFDNEEFYRKNLADTNTLITALREKVRKKRFSTRFWFYIKWAISIVCCFYMFKGCIAFYRSAKDWAAEQKEEKEKTQTKSTKKSKTKHYE